jgi:hypothetical protein
LDSELDATIIDVQTVTPGDEAPDLISAADTEKDGT